VTTLVFFGGSGEKLPGDSGRFIGLTGLVESIYSLITWSHLYTRKDISRHTKPGGGVHVHHSTTTRLVYIKSVSKERLKRDDEFNIHFDVWQAVVGKIAN
jgi:hypothetical protein